MRTFSSREPLMKYLSSTGLNWMQVTESKRNYIRRTMLLQSLDSERVEWVWFWIDVHTVVTVWKSFQTISAWHVPQTYSFIHWWWKQILHELKDGYKGCWTSRKLQLIHNNCTAENHLNSISCRNGYAFANSSNYSERWARQLPSKNK